MITSDTVRIVPARTGRPFARSRIASRKTAADLHLGRQVAARAPAARARRVRVVEDVGGDDRPDVRRQAGRLAGPHERLDDLEVGGRRGRLAATQDRADPGVGGGGQRHHDITEARPAIAAGRAHPDERRAAEVEQLLDDDRRRRRAHHRGLDRERDPVERAGVAEQPAVGVDEGRRLQAAIEAGGHPGGPVRVTGEEDDRGVRAGLGVEMDLGGHGCLRWHGRVGRGGMGQRSIATAETPDGAPDRVSAPPAAGPPRSCSGP